MPETRYREHAGASDECRAEFVKELGHGARGAAGNPLKGVGRIVVLAGEDRPLARNEQLSLPRGDPAADETFEKLSLGRNPEGHRLAELR
jgi:hypothetical protein